jgi:RimJ/RimL family protein N-acetyltransferase
VLPLRSARLILRNFRADDVDAFVAYRNHPEVARYQSWESCSEEEASRLVEKQHGRQPAAGEWFQIAIALGGNDALVGDCGLKLHEDAPRATIGITLARPHQGRGFAHEALMCLFDRLFGKAGIERVLADTDPENVSAWRLLERLGMRREEHRRGSLWFKGRWADEYLYAILREEWLRMREASGRAK